MKKRRKKDPKWMKKKPGPSYPGRKRYEDDDLDIPDDFNPDNPGDIILLLARPLLEEEDADPEYILDIMILLWNLSFFEEDIVKQFIKSDPDFRNKMGQKDLTNIILFYRTVKETRCELFPFQRQIIAEHRVEVDDEGYITLDIKIVDVDEIEVKQPGLITRPDLEHPKKPRKGLIITPDDIRRERL